MWLRSITKQQPNRSSSPAIGREQVTPINQGPPGGFNERSSSLTPRSTADGRGQNYNNNGSKPSSPGTANADPLAALVSIIGQNDELLTLPNASKLGLDTDVDFQGQSLAEFANRRPAAAETAAQKIKEEDIGDEGALIGLRESIRSCDHTLSSVESYLTSFKKDLSEVSSEIEHLQNHSLKLATRLENRGRVQQLILPALEEVSISPHLVRRILEGRLDERWSSALDEVTEKQKVLEEMGKQSEGKGQIYEEIGPILDNLLNKAVERVKDHIVVQIKAMRVAGASSQMIQQHDLMPIKQTFGFLFERIPKLGDSLAKAYMNTMRWYYANHFSRYAKTLEKINLFVVTKANAVGNTPDLSKGFSALSQGTATVHFDPLSLGRRMDMLAHPAAKALSAFVAEEDRNSHYLETPFYSFNLALLENAAIEYNFIEDFFPPNMAIDRARMFSFIFEPTVEIAKAVTDRLVSGSFDAIGVLIAIRLTQKFSLEMQRKRVPAMDDYLNLTNILLWPQFQQIMDLHWESVKQAEQNVSVRGTAIAILSGSSSKGVGSTAPHPLSQRLANLLHALLSLSNESSDGEPLSRSVSRLTKSVDDFLVKVAKGLGDQEQANRFIANNYQLLRALIDSLESPLARRVREEMDEILSRGAQ